MLRLVLYAVMAELSSRSSGEPCTHINNKGKKYLGWGEKSKMFHNLQEAMSLKTCKNNAKDFDDMWDHDSMGDHSSPLTFKKGNQHILLGSVSNNCKRKTDNGSQLKVNGDMRNNNIIKWIVKNMKNPIYCRGK